MSTSNMEAGTKAPRGKRTPVLTISVTAMFTALVFVVTQFVWVPISAVPGQRFDAGDIIIFIAAWTFGPLVGGFAGGVGSSLSDAVVGGAPYWPFTLVVKGLEGTIAGLVYWRVPGSRLKLSWLFASLVMVGGYFITNAAFIGLIVGVNSALNPGVVGATVEVPFDVAQVLAGGLIGRPVARYLRNALPTVLPSPRTSGSKA